MQIVKLIKNSVKPGTRLASFSFIYSLPFIITMGVVITVICITAGVYIVRKIREWQWGSCVSKRRMNGKVVIITGGNSGLGKEVAKDLASRGAVVVLACRSQESTQQAIREIRSKTGDGEVIYMHLDLAELESIKSFATNFQSKFEKIDVLINNAGLYVPPDQAMQTKDGFEIHFGVNHLGHFYLTNLLLDTIKRTDASRIVVVSSGLYKGGIINFEKILHPDVPDISDKKTKQRNPLYSNSKLANLLFARQLEKQLVDNSTKVLSLCPGFAYTPLMRHSAPRISFVTKICLAPLMFFIMRSPKQAAQTIIHCAVSEEIDNNSSRFFTNCRPSKLLPIATDDVLSERLWQFSETLIKRGDVNHLINDWKE